MDHRMTHSTQSTNLADILERVLDKGIVVAGDINISLVGVELLSIKVRLLVASVDKAMQIGINWWEADPSLSTKAKGLIADNKALEDRIARLEAALVARG
jgi:Gas vesicle protein